MITELEHARYDAKLLLPLIDEHCISPMHERVLFYFFRIASQTDRSSHCNFAGTALWRALSAEH